MLDKTFFEKHCLIVLEFFNRAGNICIVLLDHNMAVKECNPFFEHLIDLPEKSIGESFVNYLLPEDRLIFDQMPESGYKTIRFTLLGKSNTHNNMAGFITKAGDDYLIFAERTWLADDTIIYEISKLNNEMANVSRELNKKNIALEKANATITNLLRTDALTGIANRRYFMEYFQKMHAYSHRRNIPLSLIMADLDNFKEINDTYGHQAGDSILVNFARLLEYNCREEDLPSRYGGEEFIILLMHADIEQASVQAERMRAQVEAEDLGDLALKVTASFGSATLKPGEDMDSLIKRADDALYAAKNAGRNRVISSDR